MLALVVVMTVHTGSSVCRLYTAEAGLTVSPGKASAGGRLRLQASGEEGVAIASFCTHTAQSVVNTSILTREKLCRSSVLEPVQFIFSPFLH